MVGDVPCKTAAQLLGFRRDTNGNLQGEPGDTRHAAGGYRPADRRGTAARARGRTRARISAPRADGGARAGVGAAGARGSRCSARSSGHSRRRSPPSLRRRVSRRKSCATGCACAACSPPADSANTRTARSGSGTWAISGWPMSIAPFRHSLKRSPSCESRDEGVQTADEDLHRSRRGNHRWYCRADAGIGRLAAHRAGWRC